jgi:hypothetical protein
MNVPNEEQLLALLDQQQREQPIGQLVCRFVDQAILARQAASAPVSAPPQAQRSPRSGAAATG